MWPLSDHRAIPTSLRRDVLAWAIALAACLAIAPPAAAQSLDEFLEEYGLHELLAIHLEEQLETAVEDERQTIILRLADLYTNLLDQVADPQDRESLRRRSRELLSLAPEGSATGLRVALLRSNYRIAEQIAERHRLRLASDEEVSEAKSDLRAAIPELERLRTLLRDRLEVMDRRMERARRSEVAAMSAEADRTRQLAAQTTFLLAWARYYQAWLEGRPQIAQDAESLFAELLHIDERVPDPGEVSIDLRSDESFARSILGMALANSLTSTTATAMSWLALLEHPQTNKAIREQLPAWRLSVLLEHQDFAAAIELYRDARDRLEDAIPVAWIRLAAVMSLERELSTLLASELASLAVTDLAARGELDQVYDLAERYGVDQLGVEGFAVAYVKGVLAYRNAQNQHDSEEPAEEPAAMEAFAEAEKALRAAVEEADDEDPATAVADARRLIAWCLYFQRKFIEAADQFVAISDALPGNRAAEPLWMAIVALDRHQQELMMQGRPEDPKIADRVDRLADQFLRRFPEHEQAARLLIRRSVRIASPSMELVEELLLVPESSPVYDPAQRRAAQMLYRLFRDAGARTREAIGAKYISVAAPLNERDADLYHVGGEMEAERVAVRARRILEVSLDEQVGRTRAASDALDRLTALVEAQTDPETAAGLSPDLRYWRVRLQLGLGNPTEAFNAAMAALDEPEPGNWDRRAAMAVLAHADRSWNDLQERENVADETLEQIIALGPRVLPDELQNAVDSGRTPSEGDPSNADGGDSDSDLAAAGGFAPDGTDLRVMALVSEAAYELFARSGDRAMGRTSLQWHETLLVWEPNDRGVLRRTGLLAERFGREELALLCWRRLLAGLPAGTFDWFEARYHQLAILARTTPEQALEVLDQHALLYPEYGAEPWGSRLRALHKRLANGEGRSAPPSGNGAPTDEQGGRP